MPAKKVLFVTYYFPPSGGPGVQRPLKFVRYLREFGWEPVVLTVKPESASYPQTDAGLEQEIPSGVEVIRTHARDPYSAYARFTGRSRKQSVGVGFLSDETPGLRELIARWVRANVFLPDARVGWVAYAVRAGLKRMEAGDIDAVISTGPPQSAHLVGRRIASEGELPWIADMRDLWPDPAYAAELPTTRWARSRDDRLRDRTLRAADAVIAVTRGMADELRRTLDREVLVLPNGFDPADFKIEPTGGDEAFTVLHTGNLSPARNPESLWQALSLAGDDNEWPELSVVLVGPVDASVRESIERKGLQDRVHIIPYVPHDEAVDRMMRADVLLLPINHVEGAEGIVTGKLFEYLAAGRPILCIGPPNGEAADIIAETDAGETTDFDDVGRVREIISAWYDAWSEGLPASGADYEKAKRYSRREQTGRLASILDQLARPSTGAGTAGA